MFQPDPRLIGGACIGRVTSREDDPWYPEGRGCREAKTICDTCEVKDQCLAVGLEVDEEVGGRYGTWGGLTAPERVERFGKIEV